MIGDSVASRKVSHVFGESAQELEDLLAKIRIQWQPISIYAVGSRHYAWIVTNMPLPKPKTDKPKVTVKEINEQLNRS